MGELAAAGVEDGVIARPPYDEAVWGRLPESGLAAVAWMFPPAFEQWGGEPLDVPDSWLDLLCSWVVADGGTQPLQGRVVSASFDLEARDVRPMLGSCAAAGQSECAVLCGSPDARVRMLHADFSDSPFWVPALSACAGGPACSESDLLGQVRALALLLRRLSPPPAYAFIDMQETFRGAESLYFSSPWFAEQRELSGPQLLSTRCDEFVFDAFPWQLLGPGHLRKLPQVVAARANALAEDSFELWLDDLPRWYPTHRDATQVRAEGRGLLAGCLPRERVIPRERPTS